MSSYNDSRRNIVANKFLNLVQKQLSNGFNNSSISLNMKQILNHPKNEIIFNCFTRL